MATQGFLKPDGLHAGFNDVRSMSQSINHGSTKAGIREDRGPLPEGQICGQYQGPPFMTLTRSLFIIRGSFTVTHNCLKLSDLLVAFARSQVPFPPPTVCKPVSAVLSLTDQVPDRLAG